jgi:hypothetical protein
MSLNPKQQAALELLKKGGEYEAYFFKKVKDRIWFTPLEKEGFFKPNKNPAPVEEGDGYYSVPFWSALDYLEHLSKDELSSQTSPSCEQILEILRSVTAATKDQRLSNSRTWWYFTKILANLPQDCVKANDISLIDTWLNTSFGTQLIGDEVGSKLLPKILESESSREEKVLTLLKAVFSTDHWKGEEKNLRHCSFRIDDYWMERLIERNAMAIGKIVGVSVIDFFESKINELMENNDDWNSELSYLWRPAIEDHYQNSREDAAHLLIKSYRDVFLGLSEVSQDRFCERLRISLKSDLSIHKRVAIYLASQKYSIAADAFWDAFQDQWLSESNFHHELFQLLKKNFSVFDHKQKDRIVAAIEKLKCEIENEDEKSSQITAHERLTWLTAIKEKGSKKADQLVQKYEKVASVSTHPDFLTYVEVGWGSPSPTKPDEMAEWSVDKIVQYLTSFKESGAFSDGTYDGLRHDLRNVVASDPGKFADSYDQLLTSPPRYWPDILGGLEAAWKGKRDFKWRPLLETILDQTSQAEFWTIEFNDRLVKHGWYVTSILDLITAGTRDDSWAMPLSANETAHKIIRLVFDNVPSSLNGSESDPMTSALNVPLGRAFQALLNLALRSCRQSDKGGNGHEAEWQKFAQDFSDLLPKKDGEKLEYSVLMSAHLPNLLYLSDEWTRINKPYLYPVDLPINWLFAINGLLYLNNFYGEIYKLVRPDIEKAVLFQSKDIKLVNSLSGQIAVAYLRGIEDLSDVNGLARKAIDQRRFDVLKHMAGIFWRTDFPDENKDAQIAKQRVIEFWKKIYSVVGNSDGASELYSELSLFIKHLNELSEEYLPMVCASIEWSDKDSKTSFVIDYLARLIESSPEQVADIYLKYLLPLKPTYPKDKIKEIVGGLYNRGFQEKANRICDGYKSDFLQDLFQKHNTGMSSKI